MNEGTCRWFHPGFNACELGKDRCECKADDAVKVPPKDPSPINPAHYKHGTIECYDAIASMLSQEELRGYLRGNIMKYTWRYRHKGGATDLDKADWYFNKLKEMEKGK